jgi:hypothetical protein
MLRKKQLRKPGNTDGLLGTKQANISSLKGK